jgi:hypothetical protein
VKAGTAVVLTLAAAAAAAFLYPYDRTVFCLWAVLAHLALTKRHTGARRFVTWTLVFALPLLGIHGILNASYPVTAQFPLGIPYRADGAAFAIGQASLVMTMFVPALYWLSVQRDSIIAFLCRLPISPSMAAPHRRNR